jgi:uncharacterized membrane protein required for colicin V production
MNVADLVILFLLVVSAVSGYRKGFIGSLVGLASSLVGLFIAYKYYDSFSGWLDREFLAYERTSQFLENHLVFPQAVTEFRLDQIPWTELGHSLEKFSFPVPLWEDIIQYLYRMGDVSVSLGEVLTNSLAVVVVHAASFLALWLIVSKGLDLLLTFLNSVAKVPVLSLANRIAGLAVGLFLMSLVLSVVLGLMGPLLAVTNFAEPSLFSAVINTLGEAKLVPFFISVFSYAGRVTGLWG